MPHQNRSIHEWKNIARQVVQRGITGPTRVGPFIVYPDGAVTNAREQEYAEGRAASKSGPAEPIRGRRVLSVQGANKLYRVSGFTSAAPGIQTNTVSFTWQQSGLVIGLGATVLDAANTSSGSVRALSAMGIQIHVTNSDEDLVTNGQSTDFAVIGTLIGNTGDKIFILEREVTVSEVWQITGKNLEAGGGLTLTPEITFHFKRDPYGVRRVDPD